MTTNPSFENLLDWNKKQSYILTGGGALEKHSSPSDFRNEDLPHFHLTNKTTKRAFSTWRAQERSSNLIVGAWSRPLFSGGWTESTDVDTMAFNLQTPSVFIDMRIPVDRPTARFLKRESLEDCSNEELRIFSRQHCFAGYSLLENSAEIGCHDMNVFTRHHCIDWNFHPDFPRSRPNRWWAQLKEPDDDSFKEYSTVRDENNIPVYFERWQRINPIQEQKTKYLALRKKRPCPFKIREIENREPFPSEYIDAVFVVVGNHFSLAIDRDYSLLKEINVFHEAQAFKCQGGGGSFIDFLVFLDEKENINNKNNSGKSIYRRTAEQYLGLEGSYGEIYLNPQKPTKNPQWLVKNSTQPWQESKPLFCMEDRLNLVFSEGVLTEFQWDVRGKNRWQCSGSWEVLECSYSEIELRKMFTSGFNSNFIRSRL